MTDSYRTKVGIFLGSFDPFHIGHKEAVLEALSRGMNQVWVIPSMWNPWKDWQPVPIDERFWIAHYELEKIDRARVLAVITEPQEDGKYYSVDQLKKIIRGYGSRNFEFWLIGGKDTIPTIEQWREGNWILANFKILETFRPDENNKIEGRTQISSTIIRNMVKQGKWRELKQVMCQKSIKYIKNHALYCS